MIVLVLDIINDIIDGKLLIRL